MAKIVINPGTDALEGANEGLAVGNLVEFLRDLPLTNLIVERAADRDYGEGRYAFTLNRRDRSVEIQMPGLSLTRVRYTGIDQDIWDFPRLYVNGSSYVWKYALSVARAHLEGDK